MYESPIEIFETSTQHTTRFDEEKETVILNVIQGVGVNVDKKELIKALTYDRQQYKKGYCDGARAFAERLKGLLALNAQVSNEGYYHITTDIDNLVKELVGEG